MKKLAIVLSLIVSNIAAAANFKQDSILNIFDSNSFFKPKTDIKSKLSNSCVLKNKRSDSATEGYDYVCSKNTRASIASFEYGNDKLLNNFYLQASYPAADRLEILKYFKAKFKKPFFKDSEVYYWRMPADKRVARNFVRVIGLEFGETTQVIAKVELKDEP